MFLLWRFAETQTDQRANRLMDLEARMDAYLIQKRGKASCELTLAVSGFREKIREEIRQN